MAISREHIYLVGGAVRDQLLGLEVKDRDWVVVGITPEQMIANGYRPVGTDFPVFIKPDTGEEYALARTERKSGKGYKGFTFHTDPRVTLEQDLVRRDLTINAIACSSSGEIIDPFQGQVDLESRWLRHVSSAFSEDPLRVLRVARFAARFAPLNFKVAPETVSLMQQISRSGELETLTPERVWQEFERALATTDTARFVEILTEVQALEIVLPELVSLPVQYLKPLSDPRLSSAEQRFALMIFILAEYSTWSQDEAMAAVKAFCQRLRIPNRFRDLSQDLLRFKGPLERYSLSTAELRLALILELKLQRSEERLMAFLPSAETLSEQPIDLSRLRADIQKLNSIQPKDLIAEGFNGAELGTELRKRQLEILNT